MINEKEMNRVLAKICGADKIEKARAGLNFMREFIDGEWVTVPDFFKDLNAMNFAERTLLTDQEDCEEYRVALEDICDQTNGVWPMFASAEQRAKAMLVAHNIKLD